MFSGVKADLTQRAGNKFMSPLPIPVQPVDFGIMRLNRYHGYRSFPVVPNMYLLPVRRGKQVIVLTIPFDLGASLSPSAKAYHRTIEAPQIPPSDTCVHRYSRHDVGISSVPIDIGDSASVGIYRAVEVDLGSKVPDQQLLGGSR